MKYDRYSPPDTTRAARIYSRERQPGSANIPSAALTMDPGAVVHDTHKYNRLMPGQTRINV